MHGVVHGHEVEAGGGLGGVGVPAEEEDSDVVVPVQELGREGGRAGGREGEWVVLAVQKEQEETKRKTRWTSGK
jgi:hypothetical protein